MQNSPRAAATAGIVRLFHYERFKSEYLAATLKERKVHCSDPSALNDPWDCRPWFDENALDSESIEEMIKWVFSFTPTSPISDQEIAATQHQIRTNPQYRQGILKTFSEDFLKMIPSRWKVYCLTPVPDSTLMWSHYADNHKGICLEFGTDNPMFGSAREVTYLSSYPKWAPHLVAKLGGPHVLLTKSDDWYYEHEYRVIAFSEHVKRRPDIVDHPLILGGDFLNIPDGSIKAIIVGCEANYDEITATIKSVVPDMPIKRAVRSPSQYRLIIEG